MKSFDVFLLLVWTSGWTNNWIGVDKTQRGFCNVTVMGDHFTPDEKKWRPFVNQMTESLYCYIQVFVNYWGELIVECGLIKIG